MSQNSLAREPTWSGLAPGIPRWRPAGVMPEWLDAAGLRGRLFESAPGGGATAGLFRLEPDEGPPLFLKRAGPERRSLLEAAEAIGRWLHDKEVAVASASPGFPKTLPDGSLLVAMPYIEGRRVGAVEQDLYALGRATADLHAALRDHPERGDWLAATRQRLDGFAAVREDLTTGRLASGPRPDRLRELAAEPDLDFVDASGDWQPLHGDLNPGNVLLADGKVILLDFEDVPHSLHPPMAELCLLVERFVLTVETDEARAVGLGRALLAGYGNSVATGLGPVVTLRSRALRSLCLLAAAERDGTVISDAEWEKFFMLEAKARECKATLHEIFGC